MDLVQSLQRFNRISLKRVSTTIDVRFFLEFFSRRSKLERVYLTSSPLTTVENFGQFENIIKLRF